jgi:hypothetical protein
VADEFVTHREFDLVREYLDKLRDADQRALTIKQEADDKAKLLEQEVRAYKDASQNEWRGESSDRAAAYVTRTELKPLQEWVLSQQGRSAGISAQTALLMGLAGLVLTALLVFVALAGR